MDETEYQEKSAGEILMGLSVLKKEEKKRDEYDFPLMFLHHLKK